jgi:mannosyltransferase
VALLAIGVLAVPAHRAMREHDGHVQDTRRLTALLTAAALPGDGIVYGPPETEGRVARNLVAHYVPEAKRPKDLLAVEAPGDEGSLLVEECEDVFKCLGKTKRIWLVRSGEPKDPIAQLGPEKARPLREFEVTKTWHPDGLTLSLLVRKPA